jgi:hypothetical protein
MERYIPELRGKSLFVVPGYSYLRTREWWLAQRATTPGQGGEVVAHTPLTSGFCYISSDGSGESLDSVGFDRQN